MNYSYFSGPNMKFSQQLINCCVICGLQDVSFILLVVGIMIRLRAGQSGVGILIGVKDFSPPNVEIVSGAHPASYSMHNGSPPPGEKAGGA
jgi:hypothetical protein